MEHLTLLGEGFVMLLHTFLIICVAQIAYNIVTPFDIKKELEEGNTAVGLSVGGYFLSVVLIICAATVGKSLGLVNDIVVVTMYSSVGVVLLLVSMFLNEKIILHKFSISKELSEDKNSGVGAVMFGSSIATALIVAGSIVGEGGGVETTLAFFVFGQIALIIFAKLYNIITKYDIHSELEKDSVSVGISFAGALIAFGIILLKGIYGDFNGWYVDGINFSTEILVGFILLPIFRFLFDKVLIPRIKLEDAIVKENVAIAIVEAIILIAVALIYFFVADFSFV